LVKASFGVQLLSIVAVVGDAGLALGLPMLGTLRNIASGIMLLFLRSFKVDDVIETAGKLSTVMGLSLLNAEIKTPDGICITLSNGSV
jgi:small conductance mechanosensitive channel